MEQTNGLIISAFSALGFSEIFVIEGVSQSLDDANDPEASGITSPIL